MTNMTEIQAATITPTTPTTGSEAASAQDTTNSSLPTTTEAAVPTAATPSEAPKEITTEAPTPAENVLGDEKTVSEAEIKKPSESEKPEGDKVVDKDAKPQETAKPEDDKSALPVYEFKLPENVQFDKEPLDNFHKLLGEIETGKLDHETLQAKGQALVDMHIKATQDTLQRQIDYFVKLHNETGDKWLQDFKKDPELGAGNIQETVSNLQDAVSRFAGSEAQIKEFRDVMVTTNVGKHPALIRMIKNMNDTIRKYEAEPQNGMVPAAKPAPMKVKNHELFYTKAS